MPLAPSASDDVISEPSRRAARDQASALMMSFAERTGLGTAEDREQRYLWTDAFAVCNFLGLARATGDERYDRLALELVERVHRTLGRHRGDDPRSGWISGLGEVGGRDRPTRGGLRIGKKLPERLPDASEDDSREWDRDGQYFHYLTRWMHALDLLARAKRDLRLHGWSRDLAVVAHDAFTYFPTGGGAERMYWKMSIDLSRPLVRSMGQHDALDGFVTYAQIRGTGRALSDSTDGAALDASIAAFVTMLERRNLATADPLGLGGLLVDAHRLDQLTRQGALVDGERLERLLEAALTGLRSLSEDGDLDRAAGVRLAFRELGLAIGLAAVERMRAAFAEDPDRAARPEARRLLDALARFVPLRSRIESFWLERAHRDTATWREHRDINEVMLATSLLPDGCLTLPVVGRP